MLQSASLKKVDVGTKAGGELFSVHGSWRDFVDDPADKIVLTHVNPESLEPKAIESVGQVSKFGTVQNLIESSGSFLGDLYKGKFISILCRAFSEILDRSIEETELKGFPEWQEIINTNIVGVNPKDIVQDSGNNADSIVVWLTGTGRLMTEKNGSQIKLSLIHI